MKRAQPPACMASVHQLQHMCATLIGHKSDRGSLGLGTKISGLQRLLRTAMQTAGGREAHGAGVGGESACGIAVQVVGSGGGGED
jgi:hypothetical protein